MPQEFSLLQNYPNPFNPTTKIEYRLPADQYVTLRVYDVLGQEVARLVEGFGEAGRHVIDFNAASLANGVYMYSLKTSSNYEVKRMVLLK